MDLPPVAQLIYERPAAFVSCPEETSFKAAVIERLRRDPFVDQAARTVVVHLSREGARWTAVIRVEENGVPRGERRLEVIGGCEELAAGAALAVSLTIDPSSLNAEPATVAPEEPAAPLAEPPSPAPAVPPRPQPTPRPETPKTEAPSTQIRWSARLGASAWVGAVPGVSVGPRAGILVRHGLAALQLTGFGVLPSSEDAPRGREVTASLWGVALAPCLVEDAWRGCAGLDLGQLRASGGGVDVPTRGSTWHAAVGVELGYAVAFGHFALVPSMHAALRLTTTQLTLEDDTAWTTPRWLGAANLGVEYRF